MQIYARRLDASDECQRARPVWLRRVAAVEGSGSQRRLEHGLDGLACGSQEQSQGGKEKVQISAQIGKFQINCRVFQVLRLLLENGGDKNQKASHREFGRNLNVEDVTADNKTLSVLRKF